MSFCGIMKEVSDSADLIEWHIIQWMVMSVGIYHTYVRAIVSVRIE